MRIVIDIPDDTFVTLPEHSRARAARYVRNVAALIEAGPDNSGLVPLIRDGGTPHVAGWAVEGAPWQMSSLDIGADL